MCSTALERVKRETAYIPGLADAIEAFRAKDGRDLRDVFRSISRDTVVAVTVNLGGLDADVQTALLHLVCAQQFVAILVAVDARMRQKTLQMKNCGPGLSFYDLDHV